GAMYVPGAYTANEILAARDAGAHVIKVYPVGVAGGPAYIQVIRDPLPDVPMLAAGGTNLDNVAPFLAAGCVGVGLGASLADPQAFRTQQGCLTSGQWLIHSDLKLETALGSRARLGVKLRQYEDDAANFNYLDLTFRFPTRFGTVGALFRPLYDKSRQDFGVTWETGADTSALQVQAV